jgi:hypothetical protein
LPRVAAESSTFGWLAAIFVGGVVAGVLLWRRDAVPRGAISPTRQPLSPSGPSGDGARSAERSPAVPAPAPAVPAGQPPVYSVATWLPYVQPLAVAAGIPTAYAQKWNEVESAGQPCAVGWPFASFDGVHPLESGIAQLYGPDDYKALGIDPAAFRAYCAPRYMRTYKDANGKQQQALAFSQNHTRALIPAEMNAQAKALIDKIVISAHLADQLLAGRWDRSSFDYWAFVKLRGHGIPALAACIPIVADYLGHFPSWAEFRANVHQPEVLEKIRLQQPEAYKHLGDWVGAAVIAPVRAVA